MQKHNTRPPIQLRPNYREWGDLELHMTAHLIDLLIGQYKYCHNKPSWLFQMMAESELIRGKIHARELAGHKPYRDINAMMKAMHDLIEKGKEPQ